jgi:hypothetical protein
LDAVGGIAMKYYLYISDTKIDMLYPQVPHAVKSKVAMEFKIDVKVLSASRTTERESEENRIVRLETVVNFIRESGRLGNVDEPKEYVEGHLIMMSGSYGFGEYDEEQNDAVIYYGGQTENTVVGLGGSAKNLIGNAALATMQGHAHSHSATPSLLAYLSKELNLTLPGRRVRPLGFGLEDREDEALIAVSLATRQMKGPEQNVEFVAKRLAFGKPPSHEPTKNVLLATPLYVAMKD